MFSSLHTNPPFYDNVYKQAFHVNCQSVCYVSVDMYTLNWPVRVMFGLSLFIVKF